MRRGETVCTLQQSRCGSRAAAATRALIAASPRIRWWLFALLAAHPRLIAYRFRGRHADADDDGEASDGTGEGGERDELAGGARGEHANNESKVEPVRA